MHVGLITYQTGHLKTWQILNKLKTKAFKVSLFAFPFKYMPDPNEPFFKDRPNQLIDLDIKQYCRDRRIPWIEVGGWDDDWAQSLGRSGSDNAPDVFLTLIAKIIPASFIKDRTIINAHPGLLPENRGLDAFKWSIVRPMPVGVSIHIIDQYIDRGILLARIKIPFLPNDRLSDIARRAYTMECDLLANFDYYLNNSEAHLKIGDDFPLSKKRIPKELDKNLESIFQKNKAELIRLSQLSP